MLTQGVKHFIEQNIGLIESGDFSKLYEEANKIIDVSQLTQAFLSAGIDPLKNMSEIPNNYLCESDIKSFNVPLHITRIRSSAFWSCENLSKVVLPEGLQAIDDSAFSECYNLNQINLPASLESIKQDAFAETYLEHVVIPDLITHIPEYCFEKCLQLKTVKLGKLVQRVGKRSFSECDKLHYIQLNEGLEEIGSYAFADCFALKEIYIPQSVKKIYQSPFSDIEKNLKVLCIKDSYVHRWCEWSNQKYELI